MFIFSLFYLIKCQNPIINKISGPGYTTPRSCSRIFPPSLIHFNYIYTSLREASSEFNIPIITYQHAVTPEIINECFIEHNKSVTDSCFSDYFFCFNKAEIYISMPTIKYGTKNNNTLEGGIVPIHNMINIIALN